MSLYKCLLPRRRLPFLSVQLVRLQHAVSVEKPSLESSTEARPFDDIPGPKGLPLIGSIHHYMNRDGFSKIHDINTKMFSKYGPIFKETLFGHTMVHVLDPVDIENVYRSEGKYPQRAPMKAILDYNKEKHKNVAMMVVADGEEWRHFRQSVAPKLLRPKDVHENIENFNAVADDAMKSLRQARGEGTVEGEVSFLADHLSRWSTESMGTLVFDARVGLYKEKPSEDAKTFIKAVKGFFEYANELSFGLPSKLPGRLRFRTSAWKNLCEVMDVMRSQGQKYVDIKLKELSNDLNDPEKVLSDKGAPLLTYLLAKGDLTPAQVNDNAVDMFAGGVDTTSMVLYVALYNLAKFPEVQERVHDEIISVVGKNGSLTVKDMGRIPYTRAFLKESLRMNPPTLAGNRILDKDIVLSGYNVPAGTPIMTSVFTASRKHFKEPEEFRPERWLRNASEQTSAFAFLPFGFGARACVGKRVAELEIYLFISKAVQEFRLEFMDIEPEPLEIRQKLLLTPENLNVKFNFIDRK